MRENFKATKVDDVYSDMPNGTFDRGISRYHNLKGDRGKAYQTPIIKRNEAPKNVVIRSKHYLTNCASDILSLELDNKRKKRVPTERVHFPKIV